MILNSILSESKTLPAFLRNIFIVKNILLKLKYARTAFKKIEVY